MTSADCTECGHAWHGLHCTAVVTLDGWSTETVRCHCPGPFADI